jgi:lysyl-tRNA synthetase class 2
VTLVGRLVSRRHQGKTVFAHIRDGSGEIQLYVRRDDVGAAAFDRFLKFYDLGDFVQAEGNLFRTRMERCRCESRRGDARKGAQRPTGKVARTPGHGNALSAALRRSHRQRGDPARLHDADSDRQRHSPVSRRAGLPRGGDPDPPAALRRRRGSPFTTFHNALGQTFYLRIADELYLKRLIVGGFERVYEISKDFRNEGIDRNHSPEFTMLEFYEAYADYLVMMETVEALIARTTREALGSSASRSRGTRSTFRRRGRGGPSGRPSDRPRGSTTSSTGTRRG